LLSLETESLVIFRANLERNVEDGAATLAGQEPVRFEKLWNHDAKFFDECVNLSRFGGESGNVVARGDPDLSFCVPESVYYVSTIFHSECIHYVRRHAWIVNESSDQRLHALDALIHLR